MGRLKRKLLILGIVFTAILILGLYYYYNIYLPSLSLNVPTTTFKSTGKLDKFGILEIYPTKPEGREWFIDMNNPAGDGVFNPQSNITRQSDGSWEISGRQNTGKYNMGSLGFGQLHIVLFLLSHFYDCLWRDGNQYIGLVYSLLIVSHNFL